MTIKTMEISQFKGIGHLLLEMDGKNAVISGRNATGKTSVCDAFLWLLFGKVSDGSKADIKPRGTLGERVEGAESEVRAVLTVEGKAVELRRQLHEVWSKDPTTGEKVYSRDETLCWIDGVPVKLEKEYTPYVLGLVGGDEGTFKLLTELGAFMRLHWADRRKELVKIAGGDPDAELLAKAEYRAVNDILRGATPEDAKKRLLEQRRMLETELKTLPARIDELERTLQPVTAEEVTAADAATAQLTAALQGIEAELTASPEMLAKTNALYARKRELETRRAAIERDLQTPIREALATAEGKLMAMRRTVAALEGDRLMKQDDLRRAEAALAQLTDRKQAKLAEWHSYDATTYLPPAITTTCPTCGQDIPEDQVHDAEAKHLADWEAKRTAAMDAIKAEGLQLAERITRGEEAVAALRSELAVLEDRIRHAPEGTPALEAEIASLNAAVPKPEDDTQWQQVTAEIAATDAELAAQGQADRRAELEQRKAAIREEMKPHELVRYRQKLTEDVQARIAVLLDKKREVGAQIAKVEGDIDLLAMYVRARCSAMEENINRLFHTVRWKLFDFAKNGSLIDCCDATVNGIAYVPGGNGLNTGACVNADIEIIRVLSEAYGVTVPCFVDNAERVNELEGTGGQRIMLRVTEDAALKIALEG